jgi:ubiquinone/menaquinone biosynthesis C-methylase UbiE
MPDNSFDLYTIAFGIRNVPNVQQALHEAFRVLKPGGRFMCMEFSHVALPVVKDVYDAVRRPTGFCRCSRRR